MLEEGHPTIPRKEGPIYLNVRKRDLATGWVELRAGRPSTAMCKHSNVSYRVG